jgi:hypothetical protein
VTMLLWCARPVFQIPDESADWSAVASDEVRLEDGERSFVPSFVFPSTGRKMLTVGIVVVCTIALWEYLVSVLFPCAIGDSLVDPGVCERRL